MPSDVLAISARLVEAMSDIDGEVFHLLRVPDSGTDDVGTPDLAVVESETRPGFGQGGLCDLVPSSAAVLSSAMDVVALVVHINVKLHVNHGPCCSASQSDTASEDSDKDDRHHLVPALGDADNREDGTDDGQDAGDDETTNGRLRRHDVPGLSLIHISEPTRPY